MEIVGQILAWIASNGLAALGALVLILNGIIGICMLIPGEQPEKFLQGVVDFIGNFSKK